MKLSARNQFEGTVVKVTEGAVNGIVTLDAVGTRLTSTISMAAIRELGLAEGVKATAIVKATEVLVGLGEMKLSARNQLRGVVTKIDRGAVNAIVSITLPAGAVVSATISMAAVEELGLTEGKEAVAIIKATSVMMAV